MKIGTYLIKRSNNMDEFLTKSCYQFIDEINQYMVDQLEIVDFDEFRKQPVSIYFIGSGGTAAIFRDTHQEVNGPYFLITTKTQNSLAAAMEILSYIHQHGMKGEILHGTPEQIARKLQVTLKAFRLINKMKSMRLGVIGVPNALIASEANPAVFKGASGADLIEISMKELDKELFKNSYEENDFTLELKARGYNSDDMKKALNLYGGVRRIVDKYQLDGVALRCFDLLEPYKISGCLALAILNAEGVTAACEGDTRSLISMMILNKLSDQPIFMANPNAIDVDKNEITFAHCVLPLNMPQSYELMTHYESGLGIGIRGVLDLSSCTIFKCMEDLNTYFCQRGEIKENLTSSTTCRTQIRVKVESIDYYFTQPISNHHMICMGDFTAEVNEFFHWI